MKSVFCYQPCKHLNLNYYGVHAHTRCSWLAAAGFLSSSSLWMLSRCLQVLYETLPSQCHGTAAAASVSSSSISWWSRLQLVSVSALCSAASCLSYITKVNLFSSVHGLSISRIVFCARRQFCACRVMGVCLFDWGVYWTYLWHLHRPSIQQQSVLWFSVMYVSLSVIGVVFFLISWWLPVSTYDGSTNQQTALQLFSCPPFTRERWERDFASRYILENLNEPNV